MSKVKLRGGVCCGEYECDKLIVVVGALLHDLDRIETVEELEKQGAKLVDDTLKIYVLESGEITALEGGLYICIRGDEAVLVTAGDAGLMFDDKPFLPRQKLAEIFQKLAQLIQGKT